MQELGSLCCSKSYSGVKCTRAMNIKANVVILLSHAGWWGPAALRELREEDFGSVPSKCEPQVPPHGGFTLYPPGPSLSSNRNGLWSGANRAQEVCVMSLCVTFQAACVRRGRGSLRDLEVLLPAWPPAQRGDVLLWVTISCGIAELSPRITVTPGANFGSSLWNRWPCAVASNVCVSALRGGQPLILYYVAFSPSAYLHPRMDRCIQKCWMWAHSS